MKTLTYVNNIRCCTAQYAVAAASYEDMQSLGASFADELQVRFPHIGADEAELGNDLLAHGRKESLEGLDGPFLAHPEQTGDANIDLVDQGQILVAFGVLDFVHADSVDLAQRSVIQSPGDDVFNCIENLVPGSPKCLRRLFP